MTDRATTEQASSHAPHATHVPPPGLVKLALEFRAPWEMGSLMLSWPLLQRAPEGDGHAVIVFPGLSAGDTTTAPMRQFLRGRGYEVHGWKQGLNLGPRHGVLEAAKQQLEEACATTGRKVSLVGWSLGGIYARELAKEMPDMVRCAITLGTPFAASPRSTNAWRLYQLASGRNIDREVEHYHLADAPPVPTTSIYTRTDGVVAWQGSIQAADRAEHAEIENIEVLASHIGIGMNPSALWAVADRLAQQEGQWQAFKRPTMLGAQHLIYPQRKGR
jgi:pimeloyl-ACP methyl ester carboxylesterase